MDAHIIQHRNIALLLHEKCLACSNYDQALELQEVMRPTIFAHELLEDQKYWHLFENLNYKVGHLLKWSPEFESGDIAIDGQHQALVNHINRFYVDLINTKNADYICRELKLLQAYSSYHFKEEEILLGDKAKASHKAHHQNLIADMDILIDEIRAGKYEMDNLGDYLDFWLFNHIRKYDLPSFRGS